MLAGIHRHAAMWIVCLGFVVFWADRLPAQQTERWCLSWTDTLLNKNEQMFFDSRPDAEAWRNANLRGRNLTTGGPLCINISLEPCGKGQQQDKKSGKEQAQDKKKGETANTLKDAKDTADKAKEIHDKKGWVGHPWDEYKDKLKEAYQRVKDFRGSLSSQVGTVSKQKFDDVNRQITQYNSQVDQFASKFPSAPQSFSRLAPLTQSDLKGTLEGSTEGVGEGKYSVWVYKNESGQWQKQPERTLNTNDAKAANEYVAQVKAVEGWTATTNAPEEKAKQSLLAPGNYAWTYQDRDLVSHWSFQVSADGTIQARITDNAGTTTNASGVWKTEDQKILIKWTAVKGGVLNDPEWQDITNEVKSEWTRVAN